jgi:hypothetical protein
MEGLVVNKHAAHIIHRGGLDGYCAYLYIYMCHVCILAAVSLPLKLGGQVAVRYDAAIIRVCLVVG